MRGGHVPMTEQGLHFDNVDTSVEQQRGSRRPQGVGRIDAASRSVLLRSHRAGEFFEILEQQEVHPRFTHGTIRQILAPRPALRTEEGA